MGKRREMRTIERWFDRQGSGPGDVEALLALDPELAAYARRLQATRDGAQSVARRERIEDGQFPAFMAGIREHLDAAPRRRFGGFWTYASVAAALLLVVASMALVMMGRPGSIKAETEVESVSTDIQDATVDCYPSKNGTATVWVNTPGKDIW